MGWDLRCELALLSRISSQIQACAGLAPCIHLITYAAWASDGLVSTLDTYTQALDLAGTYPCLHPLPKSHCIIILARGMLRGGHLLFRRYCPTPTIHCLGAYKLYTTSSTS